MVTATKAYGCILTQIVIISNNTLVAYNYVVMPPLYFHRNCNKEQFIYLIEHILSHN